jgi:hypothetical protein
MNFLIVRAAGWLVAAAARVLVVLLSLSAAQHPGRINEGHKNSKHSGMSTNIFAANPLLLFCMMMLHVALSPTICGFHGCVCAPAGRECEMCAAARECEFRSQTISIMLERSHDFPRQNKV